MTSSFALRRRSILAAFIGVASVATLSFAQELKCEKYKLDNGMTVILHVDHALPIATINLWYHVGAKNEPPGRSGFAHLFEHLMFMGTQRAPGNAFDTRMESAGGANNASTDLDRTNYFSSGPSELLPTLLWLDADRMEALGPNMTTEKLDKQRDIVRNERRQNTENTPYGRAYDAMFQFVFPAGHPYHNAVIGTHADLEAATANDVRDFFATFYKPANCSLVVAGDFDPDTVKPMIAQWYGTLPGGTAAIDRAVEPVKLDRVIRSTSLDKVELPKLMLVYLAPPVYQPGNAETELAAQILGQGQNARLYRRLVVQDQTCAEASVWQYGGGLQSLFVIDVSAKPGTDLAKLERTIDEEVKRFCDEGPTPEELSQRVASTELDTITALQSLQSRADKLNEYENYFGEPDSLKRDLDRFRHATPAGVRDVARQVITPDARVVMTVLPESSDAPASPRDQIPAPALQPAAFVVPTPDTFTLASGVTVKLFHRPELPLVSARLLAKAPGLTLDPPKLAGRSTLAVQMMGEGTGDLDGAAFASALQTLGSTFNSESHRDALTTSLTTIDRNFAPAAKLWLDATFRPRLKPEDFDRVRRLQLDDLAQRSQQPAFVAAKVGQLLLYGVDSAYGVPEDGSEATIGPITLDDVKAANAELLGDPSSLTILIAGNLTREQAIAALDPLMPRFEASRARPVASSPPPAFAPADGIRVVIVHRPDAPQTTIRLLAPGITYADPQRIPLSLLNVALGGSFTSRLNTNLRETHGYTYGARSGFSADKQTGWFTASADVKADVTGASVTELLAELRRIAGGDVSADELVKAQQAFRVGVVGRFDTLNALLGTASTLDERGVGIEQLQNDLKAASAVTLDQLNAAARQHPTLDHAVLILVGDEALIREQLKSLDLPAPVTVDTEGKPAK